MVNAISSGTIREYAYGSIQRAGSLPNGRALYTVVNSEGKQAGMLSVPKDEVDKFETSYDQIMRVAPKIQKYVEENSSDEDLRQRRSLGRNIIATCGMVGITAPLLFFVKSNCSVTKKILGTIAGMVAGLAAGFGISLSVTTPPGTVEFAKAHRALSKLDIKSVNEDELDSKCSN